MSPRADSRPHHYFHSMHMTPNPLIKNSFASPDLAKQNDDNPAVGELDSTPVYSNLREDKAFFGNLSSNKKVSRAARDAS